MTKSEIRKIIPESSFKFSTSRSGGKGGQNINKVETKVELVYNIKHSKELTDDQKAFITGNLKNRIDKKGNLRITSDIHRAQFKNKQTVIEKFYTIFAKALKKKAIRKKTTPTLASKLENQKSKQVLSAKKKLRKVKLDDLL
ncbi:MAG: hypothetical protein OZ913_03220 [Ignavibacteriaceae bacterium]|jgi:Protein chain release factor B|nr:MAG: aminoacyl-tRNA hydrolase [Chlorobiota bacterium]KXK06220.1 MAG: Peptidyl-tRNA hydrolase ArfB [Chlorobi bacterium OLB4]MBV6399267.1 hypothetical protein [Ignavibacteria bacterium]MCC6884940.1 hypothetical protein [Ignavibacteriales bacterium]MCE7953529.1 aminoacyl-tRNA hydrolase [Chlorobi bacterium CHB7]MDL1887581.1 aminoacyl-tRNA hydrolase [Ignavibacteria bacterium CHB1]MEB2329291.1 hypothetical protein [Ignavibacteriaceae bacterium]OQY78466.1 MAG: hypothetical protein B6D43_03075 [I